MAPVGAIFSNCEGHPVIDSGFVGLVAAFECARAFAVMKMANQADLGFFAAQSMQHRGDASITGGSWSRNEKGENCGDDAEAKSFEHDTIPYLTTNITN